MKNIQIVLGLILLSFLTACVQGDIKLKVNKDGSGENAITVGVEEEAYDRFGGRAQGMVDSLNEELEMQGYTINSYKKGGYVGIEAAKAFENLRSMNVNVTSGELTELGIGALIGGVPIDMTTEEGFFMDTHRVEGEIDLQRSGVLGGMQQLISDQVDLTFTLDLPISPKKHNADRVDGNVLSWDIHAAGATKMMVEVSVPNMRNIVICSIIGLLLLVIIGFIIVRKRKK